MKNILVFLFIFITSFSSVYSYSTEFHLKNDFWNTWLAYQQALHQFVESHRANQEYLDEVQGRVQNFLNLQEQKNTLSERDKLLVAMFSYLNQLIDFNFYHQINDGTYYYDYNDGNIVYYTVKDGKLNWELRMIRNWFTFYIQNHKDNYLHWVEKQFYENSEQLHFQRIYSYWVKEGEYRRYHQNGVLRELSSYKKNVLHWPVNIYYENGRLKNSLIYNNWLLHGNSKSFYENGRLYREANFSYGLLDWNFTTYNTNRQISKSMQFSSWIRTWIHKWFLSWVLVIEVPYSDSWLIHWVVRIYRVDDGVLFSEDTYENGINVHSKTYSSDWNIYTRDDDFWSKYVESGIERNLNLGLMHQYLLY